MKRFGGWQMWGMVMGWIFNLVIISVAWLYISWNFCSVLFALRVVLTQSAAECIPDTVSIFFCSVQLRHSNSWITSVAIMSTKTVLPFPNISSSPLTVTPVFEASVWAMSSKLSSTDSYWRSTDHIAGVLIIHLVWHKACRLLTVPDAAVAMFTHFVFYLPDNLYRQPSLWTQSRCQWWRCTSSLGDQICTVGATVYIQSQWLHLPYPVLCSISVAWHIRCSTICLPMQTRQQKTQVPKHICGNFARFSPVVLETS